MFIEIESLEGEIMYVELSEVGACYPSDDVIYFNGIPCKLSSAQPALALDASPAGWSPKPCPVCGQMVCNH